MSHRATDIEMEDAPPLPKRVLLKFKHMTRATFITKNPEDEHYLVFRATSQDPRLSKQPRFYSSLTAASVYLDRQGQHGSRDVWACELSSDIVLCNLIVMAREVDNNFDNLWQSIDQNKLNKFVAKFFKHIFSLPKPPRNIDVPHFIQHSFQVATGLVPIEEQWKFIAKYTPNYLKEYFAGAGFDISSAETKKRSSHSRTPGYRMSWTELDDMMVEFYKLVKGDTYHGYIAPELSLPNGKMFHSELCLFDPSASIADAFRITVDTQSDLQNIPKKKLGGGAASTLNSIACKLSVIPQLLEFMRHIFIAFTKIFYASLSAILQHQASDIHIMSVEEQRERILRSIYNVMKEVRVTQHNKEIIVKPGLPSRTDADEKKMLDTLHSIVSSPQPGHWPTTETSLSLAQLMGAMYGAVVNNGVFYLIFYSAYTYQEPEEHAEHLRAQLSSILHTFRDVFALPSTFEVKDLFDTMMNKCSTKHHPETYTMPVSVGDSGCFSIHKDTIHQILLDMMIYRTRKVQTIVTRNINNAPYVRTRRARDTVGDYNDNNTSPLTSASCPKLSDVPSGNVEYIVHGDTWYSVSGENNLYTRVMQKYDRDVKAGPSGSTFMWMNFVFDLLGVEVNEHTLKLLLMCIIADFVPYYHSLPEVLHIFSREVANYTSHSKYYTYDQDPIEWIHAFIGGTEFEAIAKHAYANLHTKQHISTTIMGGTFIGPRPLIKKNRSAKYIDKEEVSRRVYKAECIKADDDIIDEINIDDPNSYVTFARGNAVGLLTKKALIRIVRNAVRKGNQPLDPVSRQPFSPEIIEYAQKEHIREVVTRAQAKGNARITRTFDPYRVMASESPSNEHTYLST